MSIRTLQQDQPGHPGAHINRDWLGGSLADEDRRPTGMDNTHVPRGFSPVSRKEGRKRGHGGAETAHNSIRISLSRPLSTSELARGWCTPPARASLPAALGFFKRQGRQVDKPVSMYAVISRARPSLSSSRNRETGFQLPQRMWYSRRRRRRRSRRIIQRYRGGFVECESYSFFFFPRDFEDLDLWSGDSQPVVLPRVIFEKYE